MFGMREGRERAFHEIVADPDKSPLGERPKTM